MTVERKSDTREDRLAQALRDNLRRRKQSQHDQTAAPGPDEPPEQERGGAGEEG